MIGIIRKVVRKQRQGQLRGAIEVTVRRRVRLFFLSNAFYPLDPERALMRRFQKTFPPADDAVIPIGNYGVASGCPLDASSIVYSFGVGKDISFDEQVVRQFGSKVHLFDPTPSSVEFMADACSRNPNLIFSPVGIWTEDGFRRFFEPSDGGSASAIYGAHGSKWFEAESLTVRTIMDKNGHSSLDLLKMDIEGAALPVLEQLIQEKVFPGQVIVELERPRGDVEKLADYFVRVSEVTRKMEEHGYSIRLLTRKRYRYFSVELLFFSYPKVRPMYE